MRNPRLCLTLILLLQSLFLFSNISDMPRWYWDDGINMEIAWNLANGEMRLYSLTYPFMPHPPLFFIVLAALLKIFGNELVVLRCLTAALSLATTVVVYFTGKKLSGGKLGLTAAFLYAIYPDNIYWSRIGFVNSMLMFLGLLALYFFLSGRRMLSCFTVSLALITQFMGVGLFFSVLLALYLRGGGKEVVKGFIVCISLPALTYILVYMSPVRDALFFDLTYALARFADKILVYAGMSVLALAGYFLLRKCRRETELLLRRVSDAVKGAIVQDIKFMCGERANLILRHKPFTILVLLNFFWATRTLVPLSDEILFSAFDGAFFGYYWIGVFGILLLTEKVVSIFFIPLLIIILGFGRTDHMILPLYPFFSLGLASLIPKMRMYLTDMSGKYRNQIASAIIIYAVIYYPFAVLLVQDLNSFVYGKGVEREDTQGMEDIVSFLDANTKPSDIVLATSHICRLIKARGAETFQGLIAEGKNISYYGRLLPRDRFLFNSSYRNAKYVVLINDTLDKFGKKEARADVAAEIGSWPVAYTRREFIVYANPLQQKAAIEDEPRPDYYKRY